MDDERSRLLFEEEEEVDGDEEEDGSCEDGDGGAEDDVVEAGEGDEIEGFGSGFYFLLVGAEELLRKKKRERERLERAMQRGRS